MAVRLSIRYKFLFVTTALLIGCLGLYLTLASDTFRKDKTVLVFDLARGAVNRLSAQFDAILQRASDKTKLIALLSSGGSADSKRVMDDVFANETEIVYMAISRDFKTLSKTVFQDKQYVGEYAAGDNYFENELWNARPVPFERIRDEGEAVWNASLLDGPPLIGFAKRVTIDGGGDLAVVSFIRLDRMNKSQAGEAQINKTFAVNSAGELIWHPDPVKLAAAASLADHPLMKLVHQHALKTGVSEFAADGTQWLGAYSHNSNGSVISLSQIAEKDAFSVVDQLLHRSFLFAAILLTLAFIAAVLFSRTLTQPLESLVRAMKRVSDGHLDSEITVTSRDEIAVLAGTFNSMIQDIRESRQKLVEANTDLEKKVKDRTRRLEEQNQKVKQAQEALLQSTRFAAVGEIAGRAAHEVLNPLTSILNRLERMRERVHGENEQSLGLMVEILAAWRQDYEQGGFERLVANWGQPSQVDPKVNLWNEDLQNLGRIRESVGGGLGTLGKDTEFLLKEGQRISRIVQGMRALTVVKGDPSALSARVLLNEAVQVMADLCGSHDIEIVEDYQALPDAILINSDEFIQCATNLIRNSVHAIKAKKTFNGPKVIRIHTERMDDRLIIDIIDNGAGITHDLQEKLFEVQFTTKSIDEGTGIGLSISRRFMRAYDGDLFLHQSVPNEGCTFRITLPLTENTVQETERKAS